jgi:hypothetical protein
VLCNFGYVMYVTGDGLKLRVGVTSVTKETRVFAVLTDAKALR